MVEWRIVDQQVQSSKIQWNQTMERGFSAKRESAGGLCAQLADLSEEEDS
jgi:hypothetical protein